MDSREALGVHPEFDILARAYKVFTHFFLMLESAKDLVGALLVAGRKYLDYKTLPDGQVRITTIEARVGNEYCLMDQTYQGPWYRLRKVDGTSDTFWIYDV